MHGICVLGVDEDWVCLQQVSTEYDVLSKELLHLEIEFYLFYAYFFSHQFKNTVVSMYIFYDSFRFICQSLFPLL